MPQLESGLGAVNEAISTRQAYRRAAATIAMVRDEELIHINIDIPSAVTTVLASLRELRSLRDEFARLPHSPLARFDELETYAHALMYVHTRWIFANRPDDRLLELARRGVALRAVLLAEVTALWKRKLLISSVLRDLKGAVGYRNIAVDLGGLAGVLRESGVIEQGLSTLPMSQLDEAEELVSAILEALAAREHTPVLIAELSEERQRAFTLLVSTWNELRRAVSYLRWNEGDAEELAPSLHKAKYSRRKRAVGAPMPSIQAAEPFETSTAA